MLEATYADRAEEPSPGMTGVKKDLLRKKESLRMLALSSQSRGQQRPGRSRRHPARRKRKPAPCCSCVR